MALNGKQIRQLRSMANTLKPTLIIGKSGITSGVEKQASDALEAHELLKCSVLDGCGLSAKTVAYELGEKVDAEVVQVIGRKFVLYRESLRDDIKKIELA